MKWFTIIRRGLVSISDDIGIDQPPEALLAAIADWDVVAPDGATRGTGSNVFTFGADGRIVSATGFWN